MTEETGKPTLVDESHFPARGQVSDREGSVQGRIEDVSDDVAQQEKDREYEERMEEEYAKREGGA